MEIPEMIGWISLGFVPLYIVHEVGSLQLETRIPAKPLLNLRSGK
jgi:hypothetical protein